MNILWILTIGSSDIQLESQAITKKNKQLPEQSKRKEIPSVWNYWYGPFQAYLRENYENLTFEPNHLSKDSDACYQIEARALGMLYQYHQTQDNGIQDEIWSYLIFPLLDNFVDKLEKETDKKAQPNAIALILTDQSAIFTTKKERKEKSFYWKDTCLLEPILERYFQKKYPGVEVLKFQQNPESELKSITLKPEDSSQGLDNWNSVLELVRQEFKRLPNNTENKDSPEPSLVYVSHQAGTPAISSAVQFCSLAKFGDRVKFLVSNEYNQELTDILPSSNYLIALKQRQAIKLLERYDYFAIQDIYSEHLSSEDNILLEAAIQWNYAEFDKFKEKLLELTEYPYLVKMIQARTQSGENWWWIGYEAAYLGVVRLKQENTVEAMFHSFRAVEGLASKWAVVSYPNDIEDRDGMSVAVLKESSKLPTFLLEKLSLMQAEKPQETPEIKLYGNQLFTLLKETKTALKNNADIQTLCNHAKDNRNELFHRLKGLNQEMLFKAWGMNSGKSWEDRVLRCLNAISDQIQFKSLTKTSLMAQVHKELKKAIAHL